MDLVGFVCAEGGVGGGIGVEVCLVPQRRWKMEIINGYLTEQMELDVGWGGEGGWIGVVVVVFGGGGKREKCGSIWIHKEG